MTYKAIQGQLSNATQVQNLSRPIKLHKLCNLPLFKFSTSMTNVYTLSLFNSEFIATYQATYVFHLTTSLDKEIL